LEAPRTVDYADELEWRKPIDPIALPITFSVPRVRGNCCATAAF
jgi:hypothetical protein